MSCSIHWRPIADKGRSFKSGTSKDLEVVKKTFVGSIITKNDIKTLRAMGNLEGHEFYNEVADVIEKVGNIEIWGEY